MIAELMPSLRFKEFTQEFELSKLEDIVQKKISYGIVQAGPHVEGGMPYIKSKNLNNELRVIDLDRTSTEIAKKYKRSEVGPGDIVFSLRGNIGVSRIVPDSVSVANLTQGTARLSLKAGFSAKYIQEELRTSRVKNRIEAISKGSTFQEISLTDLRTVKVAIPEKAEQQKIANFLTSVDTKISQLTEKHRLLKDYKKGVMQQIFSQQIRFKDDDGKAFSEWKVKTFDELLTLNLRKVNKPRKEFLALGVRSHVKGVFHKPNFSPDKIAMEELYTVRKDDLVLSITFAWEGAIAIASGVDDGGLVSHRFPTFLFNREETTPEFFKYIISSLKLRYLLGNISPGGAGRNRVLNKGDFLKIKWSIPSLEEQQKIAQFLQSLDKKIDAVNEQIEQTKLFKKGLLQQMFV